MPRFGAHMSIAGGYFKAIAAARDFGMTACQLFTKNNNQWAGKPIGDEDVRLFREERSGSGIEHLCAHASYLINLASPNEELWTKSVAAMREELIRAETLGVPGVVLHPGSTVGCTAEEGLRRIVEGIDRIHAETPGLGSQIWLETTAGQGNCLGRTFGELETIIGGVREPERLGVCLDTCHVHAAGYAIHTPEGYEETFGELAEKLGVDRVKAIHANDSAKPFGSRVDRHAHLGQGTIGLDAFRRLVNDPRFAAVPLYLETPKETREEDGEHWDRVNLQTLRGMVVPVEDRRFRS